MCSAAPTRKLLHRAQRVFFEVDSRRANVRLKTTKKPTTTTPRQHDSNIDSDYMSTRGGSEGRDETHGPYVRCDFPKHDDAHACVAFSIERSW